MCVCAHTHPCVVFIIPPFSTHKQVRIPTFQQKFKHPYHATIGNNKPNGTLFVRFIIYDGTVHGTVCVCVCMYIV